MSAKKTSKRSSRKPAAKRSKPASFANAFAAAVKAGATSFPATAAPNAARVGFSSHDRTDGKHDASAKRTIFERCVQLRKAGTKLDAKSLEAWARGKKLVSIKSGKPIKLSTIASWLGNWKHGVNGGSLYPCDPKRRSEIEKLFVVKK